MKDTEFRNLMIQGRNKTYEAEDLFKEGKVLQALLKLGEAIGIFHGILAAVALSSEKRE